MVRKLALLSFLFASCDLIDSEDDDSSSSSSSSGPVCTSTYQGPPYGEWGSPCQYVWETRCENGNDYSADQNCELAMTAEEAAECPYCAPRQVVDPSEGAHQLDTSCNSSGLAYGCPYDAPYACDASNTCFSSYDECVSSYPCSY